MEWVESCELAEGGKPFRIEGDATDEDDLRGISQARRQVEGEFGYHPSSSIEDDPPSMGSYHGGGTDLLGREDDQEELPLLWVR